MKHWIAKILFPKMSRDQRSREMNMLIVSVLVCIPIIIAIIFVMIRYGTR